MRNNSEEFSEFQPGITTDIEEGVPDIKGDPDGLMLIISNLVQNSIKYSPGEKDIKILLKREGDQLRLEVRDKGIGITFTDQKKIFDKFFRSGDKTVSAIEGSGLGLFLVTHAVNAHRGTIKVKSLPGEGSTFIVLLPVSDKIEGQ